MYAVFPVMLALLVVIAPASSDALAAELTSTAPNGLTIPKGYKKWKLIGISHRKDNDSLRAILGNPVAHRAIGNGSKWKWPKGTILAKLVWKDAQHPQWPDAVIPGELSHIEFMFKDRRKFGSTGGWGYARWQEQKLVPYPDNGSECFACHSKVEDNDYVFTRPAPLP